MQGDRRPPKKKSDYTTTIGQIRGITHAYNLNYLSEVSFGTQLIKDSFYIYFVLFRSNQWFRIQSTAIKFPKKRIWKLLGSYIYVKKIKGLILHILCTYKVYVNMYLTWLKNYLISKYHKIFIELCSSCPSHWKIQQVCGIPHFQNASYEYF